MNETLKVLESRRSCRNFKSEPVENEKLEAIMNAAESLGLGSIWIHRAKEEFESDFGKKILKDLGIEGDYEGIGHCAIGYAAEPLPQAAERKNDYVYYVK